MTDTIKGGCLCGAVNYKVSEPFALSVDCFCTDCRKTSGTGHGTHCITNDSQFSLNGTTRNYEKEADSGHMITRHFCGECGSPIFSLNKGMPGMIAIRASSLEDTSHANPSLSVFTSSAPSWDQPHVEPAFEHMPPANVRPDPAEA